MKSLNRRAIGTLILAVLAGCASSVTAAQLGRQVPRHWSFEFDGLAHSLGQSSTSDTVFGSNTISDIIYSPPAIWMATSGGVSMLTPPGNDWTTYTDEDGLGNLEIPAIGVFGSGVWAAAAHGEEREGQLVQWGDGLYLFNEATDMWIDRSPHSELPDGSIDQASDAFMLCFDLAEFRGAILGACFAGGLVISPDEGMTWWNIYRDAAARSDLENHRFNDLGNRYFSVVVDSSVSDSIAIYAGTAYGINKFTFLDPSLKVTGFDITDLSLSGSRLVVASESGLSVSEDRAGSWVTYYDTDGLPSNFVSAVDVNGDTIWAGFSNEDGTIGMGLAWSPDNGETWNVPDEQPAAVVGPGRVPRQIAATTGEAWYACSDIGILRAITTADPAEIIGEGYLTDREGLAVFLQQNGGPADLYVGTDIGIVTFDLDGDPTILDTLAVGTPADNISQRVVRIASQQLPCSDTAESALWALTRDSDDEAGPRDGHAISVDGGVAWTVASRRIAPNDVTFLGCRYFLASDSGLAEGNYTRYDSLLFTPSYEAVITAGRVSRRAQSIALEVGLDDVGNDSLVALWVGADSGLARSYDLNATWGVVFANADPYEFDQFLNPVYLGVDTLENFNWLPGNFVPTLALQPTGGKSVVWAGVRATRQGRSTSDFNTGSREIDGITYSRDGGLTWTTPVRGHQVWNFAFDGAQVWAATTQGLLHWDGTGGTPWDTMNVLVDPQTGSVIDSTVEVLAVEVIGDEVWVGTENGQAILDKSGNVLAVRRTFRPVEPGAPGAEGGTYATPVPFSPTFSRSTGGLRLHYLPPVDGNVTIKIYDFSNNLVRTLLDDEHREGGRQYDETDIWDGRNGDGDFVATGTYFYIIEYANGATHWGKIAIIP
jgi:hypothetical protein